MNRVMENLGATLLPVQLGRQTETAGWEGLVQILGGLVPAYASIKSAEAQAEAAQAQAEIERLRLAQMATQAPGAKFGDFLRKYWPHLTIGGLALAGLLIAFRKKQPRTS